MALRRVEQRMPYSITLLPVPKGSRAFYDFAEYERLVDAARALDPRTLLIVLLGREAGLRCGEMIALEWGDVDLVNRQVCVRRSDWNGQVTAPKGGRLRHVPLTRRLATALRDHRHLRTAQVLCQDNREPLTRQLVQTRVKRASRRAGLPHDGCTSCVTRSALIWRCEGRPRGRFRNWPATRNSQ